MTSATPDPRHLRRIRLMQLLFAYTFSDETDKQNVASDNEYVQAVQEILADLPKIDSAVAAAAPERPLTEVNKVDLAILRLIMFESDHKQTPKKVLINEAVELAKEFGTESSPRFVNGVLGKLLMDETKQTSSDESENSSAT